MPCELQLLNLTLNLLDIGLCQPKMEPIQLMTYCMVPGIVVDANQALRFALDIAKGMEFLHTMEPMVPNMLLNSKHVMVSCSRKHAKNLSSLIFHQLCFLLLNMFQLSLFGIFQCI